MTASEFKFWFRGFTEGILGTPNKKQWDRIKERAEMMNPGELMPSAPIIVKEIQYLPRRYWWPGPYEVTWTGSDSYTSYGAVAQDVGRYDFNLTDGTGES